MGCCNIVLRGGWGVTMVVCYGVGGIIVVVFVL